MNRLLQSQSLMAVFDSSVEDDTDLSLQAGKTALSTFSATVMFTSKATPANEQGSAVCSLIFLTAAENPSR